jgi:small Trp-rich protein
MWFVVIGTVLVLMKVLDFGPVAAWSWWAVLWPFVLAVIWWALSDAMGLTQKRVMAKMEARKAERRAAQLDSLGMDAKGRRHKITKKLPR